MQPAIVAPDQTQLAECARKYQRSAGIYNFIERTAERANELPSRWNGKVYSPSHSTEAASIYRLALQSVPPLAEELSLCRLIRRHLNSSLLVRQRR